jgi:acetyl-CoA carboxylase carboxyl transferase subunit beta
VTWFRKQTVQPPAAFRRRETPDGAWLKCTGCGEILYRKEVERSLWTCGRCGAHFRIAAAEYIQILVDEGSFEELFGDVRSGDPLGFSDARGAYSDKLREEQGVDPSREAIVAGRANIASIAIAFAVMDFHFLGGSMGSVVGERIARCAELARAERMPLCIVSCSGGARMHEGILSLMQMAKTCAELGRLHEEGIPYISILADPTTGGVSASFAMLGDVILAEPNALIGFAGPRVIRETIREELPAGFQRAEFTQAHGFVDLIVPRIEMRATLGSLLRYFRDSLERQAATGAGRARPFPARD